MRGFAGPAMRSISSSPNVTGASFSRMMPTFCDSRQRAYDTPESCIVRPRIVELARSFAIWHGCTLAWKRTTSSAKWNFFDAAIFGQIVSNLNLGRTFAHDAEQERAILGLTPAKVAEAFRKHVNPQKLVVIRAGDFKPWRKGIAR